jgi:hypothetical protein
MDNNTKIAIGLAAAVVVGYIVYKSKNPKSTTSSGKCTGEFAVECNDGSCDIGNGDSLPCLGERGGIKGGANYNTGYGYTQTPPDEKQTLGSLATLFDSQEKPVLYQEVYNTRESINIADLDCDKNRVGDVSKNCINVKNQLLYTYRPAMSWKNLGTVYPATYTLEKDNMFYEYDVNGNFVQWSPKLELHSIQK